MHLSTLHTEVRCLVRRDADMTRLRLGDRQPEPLSAGERAALRTLRRRLRRVGNEQARLMPDVASTVWTAPPPDRRPE